MKVCSVEDCARSAKNGGMCWMHYYRKRRHGNVDIVKKVANGTYAGVRCTVEGCGKPVRTNLLCNMHYLRLWKTGEMGQAAPFLAEDGEGCISREGYRIITVDGVQQREHRVIVERLLGHPLPPAANIHHWNKHRADNRHCNLVVCPDHTYHMLIEKRQRELGWKGPEPVRHDAENAGTAASIPVCAQNHDGE